jgi:hypothetical protein
MRLNRPESAELTTPYQLLVISHSHFVIELCRMSSSQEARREITSPVGPPHISLVTEGAFDENLAAISLSVAQVSDSDGNN